MLGLWSLVLALLSLTSIGSAGFAGSATKFVAKYHALDQENSLINVIETITIVVSSISLVLIIIINATFKYYDHYLFNEAIASITFIFSAISIEIRVFLFTTILSFFQRYILN